MPTMGLFYVAAVLSLTPSILAANGRAIPTFVGFLATPASCLQACADAGWAVCGLESGNECWGADTMGVASGYGQRVADSSCTTVCSGDATKTCGGENAISVYSTTAFPTAPAPAAPVNLADGTFGFSYKNCLRDSSAGYRELATGITTDGKAASCLAACSARSFNLCGLEYGGECWGSNFLVGYASKTLAQSSCSIACTSDTPYLCGGSNALSLYAVTDAALTATRTSLASGSGYSSPLCKTDNSAGHRELPNYLGNTGTVTGCLSACKTAGFAFCGVEYGGECYGGDTLASSATSSTQCTTACASASEDKYLCGGPNALTTYTATCSDPNAATCAPGGAAKTCHNPTKFTVNPTTGKCEKS
ncbi:hypothetical protein RQP46_011295 [Phenoliferia psychrophenolica]